ncbi:MAG: pyrroline-5-carboxylate reductase [Gammaproteobacteria bacterium]|nr:pyrroline-5-carboxylate reductase [Gammaproteobacteria bacterium]
MKKIKMAFVGGGNMARALVTGLVKDTRYSIRVADPGEAARAQIAALGDIRVFTDNEDAIAEADCVVFAVKPQIMGQVCRHEASAIHKHQPLVVSIAAGIECAHLTGWLDGYSRIVRVMPNTPALIGAGATGLFAMENVSAADRELTAALFASVGLNVWLEEEALIDVVTCLSGSGPAYFFYMLETMEQTAINMGLAASDARKLARQTALGAARMALQEDGELAELRRCVTSPGGTTEAALKMFASQGMPATVAAAMQAAATRASEMADEFGKK